VQTTNQFFISQQAIISQSINQSMSNQSINHQLIHLSIDQRIHQLEKTINQ
jgi:hypothetical protein